MLSCFSKFHDIARRMFSSDLPCRGAGEHSGIQGGGTERGGGAGTAVGSAMARSASGAAAALTSTSRDALVNLKHIKHR